MQIKKEWSRAAVAAISVALAASAAAGGKVNYDKKKIPPYTLEDPLTFVDGTKVRIPQDWEKRRAEILEIFQREMYGRMPPAPEAVVVEEGKEAVAFGGYATTRAPLTFDHRALLDVLADTRIPGEDGSPVGNDELQTAIGDGLAMAVARLGAASNVASRIVVLLSDGMNNYGSLSPGQAAALARHEGVKVYAIGVGTPEGAARGGGLLGMFGGGGDGVDARTLKAIAKATGGRYFDVRSRTGLEKSLAEIDALERTEVESLVRVRREELFAPWLAACCALAFLALPLGAALRRSPV